jgi:carbamoyl-phosphate synthase large subunit
LPARSLSPETIALLEAQTAKLALALDVGGLMNVQYALKDGQIYVLEVNPRASRTVPFVAKVIGQPIAKIASRIMAGETLASFGLKATTFAHVGVKEAVFPFARFPGVDVILGPEMRSTGEVMASGADFATAFARAERAAGRKLPTGGRAFLSVRDADKVGVRKLAQDLAALGFSLVATAGTAAALELAGIAVERVEKGAAVVELVAERGVDLVVNTPQGRNARRDGYAIREAAVIARVPCITTLAGARAAVEAIAHARTEAPLSLQARQAGIEAEALSAAS